MAAADAPAYLRKRRRESSRCASPTSIGRSSLRLRRPPPDALADIDPRPPQDCGDPRHGVPPAIVIWARGSPMGPSPPRVVFHSGSANNTDGVRIFAKVSASSGRLTAVPARNRPWRLRLRGAGVHRKLRLTPAATRTYGGG